MKPNVRLTEKEKAVVRIVYTRKQKTRVLHKETATHGYKKQYEVTKLDRYFNTRKEAEAARDKYNENTLQKKQSKTHDFPDTLSWDDFNNTEVQNQILWWHNSGSWLYAHGYDDWDTDELLNEGSDFTFEYDDGNSTKDFFEVLFKTARFVRYYVSKNNKEKEWKLYERV